MNTFEICAKFGVFAKEFKSINDGIINSTTLVTDQRNKKYVLQEINSYVFPNVEELMNNIYLITNYIRIRNQLVGGVGTLKLLDTRDESTFVCYEDDENKKHYFRMYEYINGARAYNEANEKLLFQAGIGFGNFQKQLQSFPVEKLFEVIPNFHNTPKRFDDFTNVLGDCLNDIDDDGERLVKAEEQVKYAFLREDIGHIIVDALEKGIIPTRVVHNDTKLNNVMIDEKTGKAVAVIDLDTVMPGSLLFDYGDAIRYCANTGKEDDQNVENIDVDMNKFKAFTKGFLQETAPILTDKELELMPIAPRILAYELGIRFLTDYLAKDIYFKCDPTRPDHNLERAKAQFALAEKFKEKQEIMRKTIFEEYDNNKMAEERKVLES